MTTPLEYALAKAISLYSRNVVEVSEYLKILADYQFSNFDH